ncbi:uncharacterized protein LOC126630498 isoform X2 [Malus sylvestris]|uniref:uncharacterized protein LOC126630498 isoform X2 n=1 Tax=Malus sylvestris TaxID=3752 RepID=UPI0021ABB6E3|nr:uncharacterized protein LOC126630498 isoform X2 [Malus sylvestris]
MECNKDDAVKAKELAERKFAERNYASAKKFVLKALNLCPELEGLSQMLTILDVYISSENKINGEADWYGVLSVTPYADDETIKKEYRKLAFMLHPDKNKCFGAEGAFKLVSEAWTLLSDKAKRVAYNHMRNVQGFQQEAVSRTGGPSVQPSASTFQNCMNSVRKTVKASQQEAAHRSGGPSTQPSASTFQNVMNARTQRGSTHIPSYAKAATFWTICNHCKTHYQYVRMYLHHLLVCPNCKKTFLAVEQAPPAEIFKSSKSSSSQQHQNSRHYAAGGNSNSSGRNCAAAQNVGAGGSSGSNSNNNTNLKQGSATKVTSIGSTVASGHAAVDAVQQASENMNRNSERRQSIAEWERSQNLKGNPTLKKRRTDDPHLNGYDKKRPNQMAMGSGGADVGGISELSKGNSGTKRIYDFSSAQDKPKVLREVPYPVIRKVLIETALTSIRNFLARSSATEAKQAKKEQETVKVKKKQKSVVNVDTSTNSAPDVEDKSPMPINVPDPDFHNFDLDRTERSFGEDQVWAAYDNDGMPRYYGRIQKVISLKPFKMRVSWLNSRSNNELGTLNWVNWTKGTRGMIRIFPTRGEIWALYRNWSPEWNQHTPDAVINKYDMVELLDEFTEEHGVSVAPLSKVAGFKTVFRKHTDPKEVKRIPKEEMFRFSHRVPSHLLTGEEAHNAPKGCWELDPAALPSELYQVITEARDALVKQNDGKTSEEIPKPQPMMTDDNGTCQVGQGN